MNELNSKTPVGVDAGGSKVSVRLIEDGRPSAPHVVTEPCNVRVVGVAAASALIEHSVQEALDAVQAQASFVGIGVAGSGDETLRLALQVSLQDQLGVPVFVMSDALAALEAHRSEGPAAILIAGTGAIALTRSEAGKVSRAGGLGAALGDPGSGTALTHAALQEQSANPASGFAFELGTAETHVPARVVELAETSKEARALLRRTAVDLLGYLGHLAEDVKGPMPIPLGLHGGLLLGSRLLQDEITKGVASYGLPFLPEVLSRPPEVGACCYAARLFNP